MTQQNEVFLRKRWQLYEKGLLLLGVLLGLGEWTDSFGITQFGFDIMEWPENIWLQIIGVLLLLAAAALFITNKRQWFFLFSKKAVLSASPDGITLNTGILARNTYWGNFYDIFIPWARIKEIKIVNNDDSVLIERAFFFQRMRPPVAILITDPEVWIKDYKGPQEPFKLDLELYSTPVIINTDVLQFDSLETVEMLQKAFAQYKSTTR